MLDSIKHYHNKSVTVILDNGFVFPGFIKENTFKPKNTNVDLFKNFYFQFDKKRKKLILCYHVGFIPYRQGVKQISMDISKKIMSPQATTALVSRNMNIPAENKARLVSFITQLEDYIPDIIEIVLAGRRGEELIADQVCNMMKNTFKHLNDIKYLYEWLGLKAQWEDQLAYKEIFLWKNVWDYFKVHDGGLAIVDHIVADLIKFDIEDGKKFMDV